MPELIGRIESARQLLAIAFGAYIADPDAYNYRKLETAMLRYQDAIYGDHSSADLGDAAAVAASRDALPR